MSSLTIPGQIMLLLTQLTTGLLESKQDELRACKWTDGESNTDTDYSTLACKCAKEAWEQIRIDNPDMADVVLDTAIPDIRCTFWRNKQQTRTKIELKSSQSHTMKGSTFGKLDINQPVIYCLRPSNSTDIFKVRYALYHVAMGESDTDLFQDRTPRPMVNFNKMSDSTINIDYIAKDKIAWCERYAECAMNRIDTKRSVSHSWQDDLVRRMKKLVIDKFISETSNDEFAKLKELYKPAESSPPSEPAYTPAKEEPHSQ